MSCIQFHSPLPPLPPQSIHKQRFMTHQSLWPSSNTRRLARYCPKMPTRTMVTTNPPILGVTSPGGGDISVLLPTSAVLLFAYVIANFVVPAFISKQFQFDEANEEPTPIDDSSSDDV